MLSDPLFMTLSLLVIVAVNTYVLGSPLQPPMQITRPLSRLRRARVIWLITQAQELLLWSIAVGLLLVTCVIL